MRDDNNPFGDQIYDIVKLAQTIYHDALLHKDDAYEINEINQSFKKFFYNKGLFLELKGQEGGGRGQEGGGRGQEGGGRDGSGINELYANLRRHHSHYFTHPVDREDREDQETQDDF
jgi:hypothetical protein